MRVVAGIVLVAAVMGLAAWGISSRGGGSAQKQFTRGREPVSPRRPRSSVVRRPLVRLVEQPTGELAAPLQDAAAAPIDGRRVLLLGGLTAADTSSDGILVTSATSDSSHGRLPAALHDAAAVRLDGSAYLFGGGNGRAQLDEIVRVDPANGRPASAGRLPAPSSDQAAATIGATAYVVGGFTGTRWLDTIVAWRPGTEARVVAHLPLPLRYPAVTNARGRLIIAGGSTPAGAASSAVLAFDPRTARISPIGRLPAPTTHAAAASLRGVAYVIGGRGARVGTPTARIVAVDPRSRRVRSAGTLATPRSDLAATRVGSRILLVGGRGPHGTVTELSELQPEGGRKVSSSVAARTISHSARVNVYAADRPGLLAAPARRARSLVYVPNSESGSVDEIDPRSIASSGTSPSARYRST